MNLQHRRERPTDRRGLAVRLRRVGLIAVFGLVVALPSGPSALATVPGPDGLIAFRADTGSGDQIYTIRPDGTGQTQLTFLDGDNLLQPHWSPDSRLIVFELDTPDSCANVAYMNADGTNMVVLPLANGDICEAMPSFSPDGQRIYYEAFDGHRDAIWSMALDGTDRHWVTSCLGRGVTDPEVSPDGTMIAFTCFSRRGSALFDSNIDGSHLRQLTPFSFDVGTKEDWSPDSARRPAAGAERPVRPVQDPSRRHWPDADHSVFHIPAAGYGLGLGELMHPGIGVRSDALGSGRRCHPTVGQSRCRSRDAARRT